MRPVRDFVDDRANHLGVVFLLLTTALVYEMYAQSSWALSGLFAALFLFVACLYCFAWAAFLRSMDPDRSVLDYIA
ncbi:hypothetical protein HUG10_05915 [Halorarum halophilum]|uniref:Uncharacterized protein n=1 Tax=Halorarum halophilum TaxID=2743090 RepID=A0A7D5GWQ1_9EURY|nr:hypothetical protein [Halobaculum halophilum]QLG27109.1 hypothetical protein HUG10_05915 [Halobaculum halophilum]